MVICARSADNLIHFDVRGAGEIAGVDNGNAATTEPFHADHRKAFNGMALLILRSHVEPGKIHVVATGDRSRARPTRYPDQIRNDGEEMNRRTFTRAAGGILAGSMLPARPVLAEESAASVAADSVR